MSTEIIEDMIRASEVSARVETAVLALGKQPGWFFKTVGWDPNRWEQVVGKGQGMVRLPELVHISSALCVPLDYLKNQAHFNGSPKDDNEQLRDAPRLFTDGDRVYGELFARLCEVEPFAGCAKFELEMTPEQLAEVRAGVRPVRIPKFVQLLSRDLITPPGSRLRGAESDAGETYRRLLGLLADVPEWSRGELVLAEEDIEVYEAHRAAQPHALEEDVSEDDPAAVADGTPTLDDAAVHAFRSSELGSPAFVSRQDCGSVTAVREQVEDGHLSSTEPSQEECGESAADPPDDIVDAEDHQASPSNDCPGDGISSEDEVSETPVAEEVPEEPDYDTPGNRKQVGRNVDRLIYRTSHGPNTLSGLSEELRRLIGRSSGYAQNVKDGRAYISHELLTALSEVFDQPIEYFLEDHRDEEDGTATVPVAPMDRVSSAEEQKTLDDAPKKMQEAEQVDWGWIGRMSVTDPAVAHVFNDIEVLHEKLGSKFLEQVRLYMEELKK